MPRLNNKGQPTVGYGRQWFDDDRYIFSNEPEGDLRIKLSDGTILAEAQPTLGIYAGFGRWAAEVPGGVIWGGAVIDGAALGGYCDPIGVDGTLVVKRKRNSFGPWGFVGGAEFGGDCRSVTNYGGGRASWIEGNWEFRTNFGSPHERTRCYNYRLKTQPLGDDFLFQSADTGELVFNGRVIGKAGDYFRPDFYVRSDGKISVIWGLNEGDASFSGVVLDRDTLDRLPVFNPSPAKDVPVPTPPAPPATLPSQLGTIEQILSQFSKPLGENHWKFLVKAAIATGGKLYKKPGGDHTTLPDGTPVSLDILIFDNVEGGPFWVDILGNAEGATVKATWDVHPNAEHPENFVDVSKLIVFPDPKPVPAPTPAPAPVPPPVVTPPPPVRLVTMDDLAKVLDIIQSLDQSSEGIEHRVDALVQRVNVLVAALKKGLTSSKVFAHSHVVKLGDDVV